MKWYDYGRIHGAEKLLDRLSAESKPLNNLIKELKDDLSSGSAVEKARRKYLDAHNEQIRLAREYDIYITINPSISIPGYGSTLPSITINSYPLGWNKPSFWDRKRVEEKKRKWDEACQRVRQAKNEYDEILKQRSQLSDVLSVVESYKRSIDIASLSLMRIPLSPKEKRVIPFQDLREIDEKTEKFNEALSKIKAYRQSKLVNAVAQIAREEVAKVAPDLARKHLGARK